MDLAVVRDFLISAGIGLILVLFILAGVIGFLLYRKIKSVTASINVTVKNARQVSSEAGRAVSSVRELSRMSDKFIF